MVVDSNSGRVQLSASGHRSTATRACARRLPRASACAAPQPGEEGSASIPGASAGGRESISLPPCRLPRQESSVGAAPSSSEAFQIQPKRKHSLVTKIFRVDACLNLSAGRDSWQSQQRNGRGQSSHLLQLGLHCGPLPLPWSWLPHCGISAAGHVKVLWQWSAFSASEAEPEPMKQGAPKLPPSAEEP